MGAWDGSVAGLGFCRRLRTRKVQSHGCKMLGQGRILSLQGFDVNAKELQRYKRLLVEKCWELLTTSCAPQKFSTADIHDR
jgi:hypothetical protein